MPSGTRLSPGEPAPTFTLPDATGTAVAVAGLRGQRLVLYFYPAAGTPGCTQQACDFRDNLSVLAGAGLRVVGVSPDTPGQLAAFAAEHALPFTLLADPDRVALEAYGAYGVKKLYGREVVGVIRSTFLIDADGIIEEARYGVRATGHVASLLRRWGIEAPGH